MSISTIMGRDEKEPLEVMKTCRRPTIVSGRPQTDWWGQWRGHRRQGAIKGWGVSSCMGAHS